MSQKVFPRQPRKASSTFANIGITVVLAIIVLSVVKAYTDSQKKGTVPQTRVAAVAPMAPLAQPPETYEAVLPPLTDEQRWYKLLGELVVKDPQRWVGEWIPNPNLSDMTDNDEQVWIGLLVREDSLLQYDNTGETAQPQEENNDCRGLGQICPNPDICPVKLRWIPPVNLYCSARYFEDLVHKYNGGYDMAVAEYEGARKRDANGQLTAIPDPTNPDIQKIWEIVKRH